MNALNYAIACQQSYSGNYRNWIGGWMINGVDAKLTRIDGEYVLVLRGSQDAEDWLRDLDAIPVFDERLGWVHRGFMEGLKDIYNAVRNCTGGEPLSFTGHSLGGARSRLLAGLFISNRLPVKNLVTFGSPKPGFQTLKEIINKSTINHVSYRNNEDVIPTLPETMPPVFDYVHTEDYILVNSGKTDGVESIKDHSIDLYVKALQNG